MKRCRGKNGKSSRWALRIFLMDRAHGLKCRKSIFPDFLSNDPCPARARIELEIPVELTEGLSQKVVVIPSDEQAHQDPSRNPRLPLSLTTLPPITLSLTLPPDYPLRRPPVISSLRATYGWLPAEKLQTLEKALLRVWEAEREQGNGEGRVILYDWVEMVRSAEPCLGALGMMTGGELLSVLPLDFAQFAGSHSCRIKHPTPALLAERLASFDSKTRLERFSQTSYACGVCLSSIKGAKCISLACGHVFCRACLVDFWGLCISEGDVDRVGCPDPECVKQGTKAPEDDVRRVMSSEGVTRWKWLKEKKELEKGMKLVYMRWIRYSGADVGLGADPTIIHCPMDFCQHPVKRPTQVENESSWERLRTCTACGYSFCAYCRRTWYVHRPESEVIEL